MESENVRVMRAGYEAFNRGDFDAAVELLHPEVEFQRADIAPETGSIRGVEAIRAWMQPDIFEEQNVELLEVVENGDRVLVEGWFRVKARASGIVIEDRAFHVWTVRDGKAVRLEFYSDRSEARAATGLDPG